MTSFDHLSVTAWSLSHDEKKLAISQYDSDRGEGHRIRIHAVPTMEVLQEIPVSTRNDAYRVVWSPDGESLAYSGNWDRLNVVELATGRDVQLPITRCDYRWIGDSEMVCLHQITNPGLDEGEDLEAVVSHLDLNTLRITRVEYKEPRSAFAARFPVYRLEPSSELATVGITESRPAMNPFQFATDTSGPFGMSLQSSGTGMYVQSRDGQYTRIFFRWEWIYAPDNMLVTSDMRYVIWRNGSNGSVHVVELTVGEARDPATTVFLDPGSISAEALTHIQEGLQNDARDCYVPVYRALNHPLNGQPLTADAGRGGLVGVVRLVQRIDAEQVVFLAEMAWELENRQDGDVAYGLFEERLERTQPSYAWFPEKPWGLVSNPH